MLSEETKTTLLALAAFAPTIPDKEWELEVWWCGTHGCLIGNAIKKGLLPQLTLVECRLGEMQPRFGEASNFRAIAEALSLPETDIYHLFSPDPIPEENYTRQKTQREIADTILAYVAAHS